jgi:hypothetical protein
MGIQADGQKDRQAEIQTDKLTDRQTGRQVHIQTGRQIDIHSYIKNQTRLDVSISDKHTRLKQQKEFSIGCVVTKPFKYALLKVLNKV